MIKYYVKVRTPTATPGDYARGAIEVWADDLMNAVAIAAHLLPDLPGATVLGVAERIEALILLTC